MVLPILSNFVDIPKVLDVEVRMLNTPTKEQSI